MYKKIEVSEIIGSVYVSGSTRDLFEYSDIIKVVELINKNNSLITAQITRSSIIHVADLSEKKSKEFEKNLSIPSHENIRNRFRREFYGMDLQTRELLLNVVKDIFSI